MKTRTLRREREILETLGRTVLRQIAGGDAAPPPPAGTVIGYGHSNSPDFT